MSLLSRILQTRSMLFLFDNLSCSEINSHISKIMSIQSLIVEMKLDMSFFKSFFFKSQACSIKDPTHVIQCNPLIVLYFEGKKKLTRCKNKMAFPMVFCVSFNLWSWVYYLMVCDEVTLCEFQERWFLLLFFLAFILSVCIITSSLIHETTTLMEKLFKLWECHLSVQIAYLIKKGF
jgi:hypothetical protein